MPVCPPLCIGNPLTTCAFFAGASFGAEANAAGSTSRLGAGSTLVGAAPCLPAEVQAAFQAGAAVYDCSHKRSRGYGVIVCAGSPAADGQARWVVDFGGGQQRKRAISETYLELPLLHHCRRSPPSGLQQEVLVVLGMHKSRTGITVRKVRESWVCSEAREAGRRGVGVGRAGAGGWVGVLAW